MIDYKRIAEESGASQDNFEMRQMLQTVAQLQPKKILEIGVHTGNCLKAFSQAYPGVELFGLEIDTQYLHFKDFTLIEGDGSTPEIIKQVSRFAPFDFIFIDGDHRYAGVKADWENYKSMVRPGGIIGFHDTRRMGEGWMSKVEVKLLLDEIWSNFSHPYAEFWHGPDSPGTALVWL